MQPLLCRHPSGPTCQKASKACDDRVLLSVCIQAAAHNAELQVASLEAALQKGSEVTVSMTEKVAQALAAANAQVEALKVMISGYEASL